MIEIDGDLEDEEVFEINREDLPHLDIFEEVQYMGTKKQTNVSINITKLKSSV